MKLLTLTAAAVLALSVAMPSFAQEAATENTDTPNDTASDAAMGVDALGIDVMATGATDEERMAFFMAMSEPDRTSMMEKCTTYMGRDESLTPNEDAEMAAMSFCKVVMTPQ